MNNLANRFTTSINNQEFFSLTVRVGKDLYEGNAQLDDLGSCAALLLH